MALVSTASPVVSTEPVWQDSQAVVSLKVPLVWRRWLLDRGSLTRHLTAASKGDFRVRILLQSVRRPHLSERTILNMPHRGLALIREVLLYGQDQPWVFARSVLPLSTLTGPQRCLRQLDNRPLGALLFADPNMRRGAMQLSRIKMEYLPLSGVLSSANMFDDRLLWGRRSVFYIDQKPLLVSEIFLPDFCPYNKVPNRMRRHK